jgi:hypothetical protein
MERAAWTDERLDDLADAMRSGFDRLDGDLRDVRIELREQIGGVRAEIGGVRGEIGDLREEMREEIGGLRGAIDSLKTTLLRASATEMVGLLGIIAAILARG